jgi:hypothetical protein
VLNGHRLGQRPHPRSTSFADFALTSGTPTAERSGKVRAGWLAIGLIVLASAGFAVGSAQADITVDVPGVGTTTIPTPPVDLPGGSAKGLPPNIVVRIQRGGGRPSVTVNPGGGSSGNGNGNGNANGNGNGNGSGTTTTTPPAPTTPDPRSDPTGSTATTDTPAADAQPAVSTPTTTTSTSAATPSHTTAAKSAPAPQSHTVAPITRSGGRTAPRRVKATTPHRAATKPTFIADVTPRRTSEPHVTKRTPQATTTTAPREDKPSPPKTIGTAIGDVVDHLPGWVLGIFVGFAALAVAMAINAYASSRLARRLAAQRAGLADDVGHLQAALLATVPETPGDVAFSVAYRPAAGLAAGGDFYDVFELDGARTAIVLGDVSGHGRESVAHAALVRYTLRTFIAAGHAPAEAIALTDPCLEPHLDGQFATVITAVYDHTAHELTYAKAGHHPPLVLGIDDEVPAVATAPPIGAGLGGRPTDVTLRVAPGATVCFFTDGLVEARRAGRPLGTERVEQLLCEAPDDAEALIAAVAAEVDGLNDDLAVCLLHRPAEETSIAATASDPLAVAA